MKRGIVLGMALVLFISQVQTVFAQDRQTENLFRAINAGNVSDARSALQRRADVNYNSGYHTPLVAAIQKGNLEIVRLLLENGADPNRTGTFGRFALPEAIEKGNLEIVRLLLDRNANVNRRDHIGASPLRSAIDKENLEMVRLLIDRGASVNDSDRYGTPFPAAAQKQNFEILRFLLERGANINGRCHNTTERGVDIRDRTALHHAVSNERIDIVRYLVENGINVNARDSQGRSALNIALEKGEMNIHAYLIANGAMEFEPTQVTQPAAPAPSTTIVNVQPSTPAQSTPAPAPSRPTLRPGRYACSGTNVTMEIQSPLLFVTLYRGNSVVGNGTYSISGNNFTLTVIQADNSIRHMRGVTYAYTITSETSFSGSGETWVRR